MLEAAERADSALVIHRRNDTQRLTAGDLLELALARRRQLHDYGITAGDRVGVIGPTSVDFVAWAYAVWLSRATLVPLPSPIRVRHPEALRDQTQTLSDAFACRIVVAHPKFVMYPRAEVTVPWDRVEPQTLVEADVGVPDDLALILCTSGSTALPKGVAQTHARLVGRNVKSAVSRPERREQARPLSFLPLSHAGGVGAMLMILQRNTEAHIMAAEWFARDPAEWLRLGHRVEATLLSAASSAWAAALTAAQRRPDGVDLSRVQRVLLSMEMVDPDVVDQLHTVGARFGLRPEVIGAVYGLSEGGSTTTLPGEGIRIDQVDLDVLVAEGRAVAAAPGAQRVKRVAGCGRPIGGLELRVMGPDGPEPDRVIGEIQFRGRWTMDKYVGPAADDPFVDGWLGTGDLGYLVDGELYVTGRVKELIVHLGRNYHPEDIERLAAHAAGVAVSACVAFSPLDGKEGDVVLALETAEPTDELEGEVRAAVTNGIGIVPAAMVFVAPGTLPKAANGKQQRIATRDMYSAGTLMPT